MRQHVASVRHSLHTQLKENNGALKVMLDVYEKTARKDVALVHAMNLLHRMHEQQHAALIKLVALDTLFERGQEQCCRDK